jgi:hypothetical protein
MNSKWKVFALDHSGEQFEVGRGVCLNGIYSYDRYDSVFESRADAEAIADLLNDWTTHLVELHQ